MVRFRNVLVAGTPGHLEPSTLRAAVELAEANRSQLTLIDVVTPLAPFRKKVTVEGEVIDIESALLHDREARLHDLAARVGAPPDVQVVATTGEPFLEVIHHVLAHGNDLVMVGGGDVPELGSGVMHLLRKCPVPVWVMRPRRDSELRILALVDPDPGDPVRDGLNDLVLELATSLAASERAELHVAHAWSLVGEPTLRSSPYVGLPGEVVDVMVKTVADIHADHVEELVVKHRVRESGGSVHLVPGDADKALPQLAERLGIGLIVMGTVARTGLRGLIIGNTAESILRAVRCSVLAVKPEGFVTPVKPAHSKRA